MSSDDAPDVVLDDPRTADAAGPERKCVLSGTHGARAQLIRLALGPDNVVWPDLGARLPGRGAWVSPDRALLEATQTKGKLKGVLARAFAAPAIVPEDLAQRIADGLEKRALERLGLELRAGYLIFGSEKLSEWARGGRLHLLLHAGDAAEDGVQKLNQAWRSGGGDMGRVFRLPAGRAPLSQALGRENIVHSGVTDGKAAARIAADVSRWAAYLGLADIGSDQLTGDGGDVPGRRNDEGRA